MDVLWGSFRPQSRPERAKTSENLSNRTTEGGLSGAWEGSCRSPRFPSCLFATGVSPLGSGRSTRKAMSVLAFGGTWGEPIAAQRSVMLSPIEPPAPVSVPSSRSPSLHDMADVHDPVLRPGPCEPHHRALARQAGGPVRELACGTGRLTLPIARDGHEAQEGVDGRLIILHDVERWKDLPIVTEIEGFRIARAA